MAISMYSRFVCRTRLQLVSSPRSLGQIRHASLIKRPYRPYTFTQLVVLSDGSTFTTRTTSPAPVYKATKDSRNHPLWQPSSAALRNVEADEAGKLRAFRSRFGHSWDTEDKSESDHSTINATGDNLIDLISSSGFGTGQFIRHNREDSQNANSKDKTLEKSKTYTNKTGR